MHTRYEFLGTLRNAGMDGNAVHRSAWKGVYEKRDAIIELGVYEKEGEWYVIKSAMY